MDWMRRHDEYDEAPKVTACCRTQPSVGGGGSMATAARAGRSAASSVAGREQVGVNDEG